ncbi:hypothetical protein NEOLEDRAFT_1151760 [Neolentinus lepideus HHB14362 ss-1]|uniref:Uncharacterized protein n=1 Tax=Neolentinus lepideus HHB14362 ss-1 TaxID=1314782 RepID=A0A165NKV4_9AGAM|nr:hypothetical protein NEOLEDRAFT_1151760 [Neolentinus lepideus HHB14362 ss-1]
MVEFLMRLNCVQLWQISCTHFQWWWRAAFQAVYLHCRDFFDSSLQQNDGPHIEDSVPEHPENLNEEEFSIRVYMRPPRCNPTLGKTLEPRYYQLEEEIIRVSAVITYLMCRLVADVAHNGDQQVITDTNYLPTDPSEFCKRIFHTCHIMGTKNSSIETMAAARLTLHATFKADVNSSSSGGRQENHQTETLAHATRYLNSTTILVGVWRERGGGGGGECSGLAGSGWEWLGMVGNECSRMIMGLMGGNICMQNCGSWNWGIVTH